MADFGVLKHIFQQNHLFFHLVSSLSLHFSFISSFIFSFLFHLVSSFLFHLFSLLHLVSLLVFSLLSALFSSLVFHLLSSPSQRCSMWISLVEACFVVSLLVHNELIRNAVPGVARCIAQVHVAHSMRPQVGWRRESDPRPPTMLTLFRHSECATTLASR